MLAVVPQSRHFGLHKSITHLYGFLVVSIVANDISILTVYGNLTKWAIFHFEFNWFGIKDRRLTSKCNRPKFEFDSTASERIPAKITYVFVCVRSAIDYAAPVFHHALPAYLSQE